MTFEDLKAKPMKDQPDETSNRKKGKGAWDGQPRRGTEYPCKLKNVNVLKNRIGKCGIGELIPLS